jgi:DnaJ-domain-containing protein 1
MDNKTAYPLCWPDGWKRTPAGEIDVSRFYKNYRNGSGGHSMAECLSLLQKELDLLGAENPVVSTNIRLRLDGQPVSNAAQPNDRGAAIYFVLDGKPVSLACDKWNRVECNLWAIAKHIEALRGQERWGVGNIAQAFRGYMALPAPRGNGSDPFDILGIPKNSSFDQVKDAYRNIARAHHPDTSGSDGEFFKIAKEAYENIERMVGVR